MIENLKPSDLNCNIFSAYDYPGMTIQELLCQFFTKINECVKQCNDTNELTEWLVNEGLSLEVTKKLTQWLNDGTLENLINVTLFEGLNNKIDNVSSQLVANKNELDTLRELKINVKRFGAKGDGITDDTKAIQDTIDYAFTKTQGMTGDNVVTVILENKQYRVNSQINLRRNIKLMGGTLLVYGNIGINMENCLYTIIDNTNIKLQLPNQIAISIQQNVPSAGSASQLNQFYNVVIEGNNLANTSGIKLGYTWVNSFYSCKIFRCTDGLWFDNVDSNANIFYNCEVRGEYTHTNNGTAIIHANGKNNAFIGGVVENYKSCVDVRSGDFRLQNVYTELFGIDKPFLLQGGTLTVDSCLLKGKFDVRGGEMLRITNNDATKGGFLTNVNSPLVTYTNDITTKLIIEGNNFKENEYIVRHGYYFNKTNSTWIELSKKGVHNLKDMKTLVIARLTANQASVTGDSSQAVLKCDDVIVDSLGEYSTLTGLFTPLNGGFFRITTTVKLTNIKDTNVNNSLFIVESNGKSYRIDYENYLNKGGSMNNEITLSGSATLWLQSGQNIRVLVMCSGSAKDVSIEGKSDSNVFTFINIERMQ
ncbi:glycosyl hydrolase family 28-related protein [Romboutsia sp.]|uniref:glycosyl hydrolase family 28-related protein n=1 Tax=Romboutsia sp. TaxID=1965302 RepID=UPI003F3C66D4